MDKDMERGQHALRTGDLETAHKHFDRAIKRNPRNAEAYLYRAKAYQEQGELQLALSDLEKASEFEPENNDIAVLKERVKELISITKPF